jgi:small subunit ribosomal protein S19|tara:strand:+ start:348 stop:605 length:258 start_codon:yes stop_codon:yes gene_type:complete
MGKRSLWKGPFICNNIISDLKNNNSLNTVKTTSRSTTVLPFLIGKTVKLHNGKFYISIKVTEEMIGHKLGEFVPTRLRHVYKKKK